MYRRTNQILYLETVNITNSQVGFNSPKIFTRNSNKCTLTKKAIKDGRPVKYFDDNLETYVNNTDIK